MSRLDSAIRRLLAQRACLNLAAELIATTPGHVLELGLGNGRTYDHLRQLLPGREIFVFERAPAAHPDCTPDARHLLLGDFRESLRAAVPDLIGAALIHADIGSGDTEANRCLAAAVAPWIERLVAPQGVVASDQALPVQALEPLELPSEIAAGRYFLYRSR